MKRYVLLFLPLVIFGLLLLGFFIVKANLFYKVRDYWISIGFLIGAWGCIQTLFVFKRPHKSRFRLLLSACILLGAGTPIYLILTNSNERLLVVPLALASNLALISYVLRHKQTAYSLAPGWAQLKKLGIIGCLVGWAFLGLFLVDSALNNGAVLRSVLPSSRLLAYLVIPWGAISALGIVSYYVEEILHQKRNTGDEWQKQIDNLGS